MTFQSIAEELGKTGLCICPDFLSPKELKETREDLEHIQRAGVFELAGTGQDTHAHQGHEVRQQVRRDETHWLNRGDSNPAQDTLWGKLDGLKQAFNRTLYLRLLGFEGHYAAYSEGGFYRRHRDSFQADDARVVSVILYLNPDWQSADGGMLRVYHDGKNGSVEGSHTDVAPIGGTLVCFMSGESEHEVLESHALRLSFTGWFKK